MSKSWVAPAFWLVAVLLFTACANQGSSPFVDENTLFHDEFITGAIGDWVIEGDESGRTAVVGEQMVIEVDAPNLLQFTTLAQPTFTDFVLEVDVRQLAGDPESSFGVLFRLQDPQQFYRFEITPNGLYMVEKHNADGSWMRLIEDWTETPAINQGLNIANRLKVVATGPLISVYVNGILLQQISDPQYTSGAIALDAGTFGTPGLRVAFDNVMVSRP